MALRLSRTILVCAVAMAVVLSWQLRTLILHPGCYVRVLICGRTTTLELSPDASYPFGRTRARHLVGVEEQLVIAVMAEVHPQYVLGVTFSVTSKVATSKVVVSV
jgi:hypothetical protein